MSIINTYESVPVKIGDFTLYCEKCKVSGTKSFSEQNTVLGEEVITNYGKKAVRIVLSGRICGDDSLGFIATANSMMYSTEDFSVEYRNIIFKKCRIQSFIADDQNNDFISATVTVIALEVSTKSEESV